MAIRNAGLGTFQFNPYAAGAKKYGRLGGDAATTGPVDKSGYLARDSRKRAQRNALQAAMRQNIGGARASANSLRMQ